MTEDRRPRTEDRGASRGESVLARVNAVIRRIIGAPDYSAYVKHMSSHHPGCELLSQAEFVDEQLTARYSTPGSRCC